MMLHASKITHRATALSLVALVFFVLAFGVLFPVVDGFRTRAGLVETQKQQLAEYIDVVAQAGTLRKVRQSVDAERHTADFMDGESEIDLQTQIQAALMDLSKRSEARIRATRKLAPRERGQFQMFGVGVDLIAEIATIQKFLHGLESARPYLFIEAATIAPLGGGNAPPDRETLLEARLEIYAANFGASPQ